MKAAAVIPGKKGSFKVVEMEKPVPGDDEVLVKVLCAGIDGTDVDIYEGKYGTAPPGCDRLVLGHEAIGVVEDVGAEVKCLCPGDIVVPTVRRPCPECCYACVDNEADMCLSGDYSERGIKGLDGYMTEYFIEHTDHVVKIPGSASEYGIMLEPLSVAEKAVEDIFKMQERMWWNPKRALVLGAGTLGLLTTLILRDIGLETYTVATRTRESLKARLAEQCGGHYVNSKEEPIDTMPGKYGPFDVVIEATGASSLAMDTRALVSRSGIVCLLGIYSGEREESIDAAGFNNDLVFNNKAVFGSVSSNRRHFERGISRMISIDGKWPGIFQRFYTRRVSLDSVAEGLGHDPNDIKVLVDIAK